MTQKQFGEAYQQGLTKTIAFLLSRGVPSGAVADIAQSAWTRGWERLEQLREASMVFAWINTIALNLYRKTLRRQSREEEWKPLYDEMLGRGLNWAAIDVARILDACRPSDRSLLKAQLEGKTAHELARTEGVSPTAIRIRMLRARRTARKLCEPSVALRHAA